MRSWRPFCWGWPGLMRSMAMPSLSHQTAAPRAASSASMNTMPPVSGNRPTEARQASETGAPDNNMLHETSESRKNSARMVRLDDRCVTALVGWKAQPVGLGHAVATGSSRLLFVALHGQ